MYDNAFAHFIMFLVHLHTLFSQNSNLTKTAGIGPLLQGQIRLAHFSPFYQSSTTMLAPPLVHEWDFFLMDYLRESELYSQNELKVLNHICIHLQVLMMGDITTGVGRHIWKCFLQGHKDWEQPSRWDWAKEEPCHKDFKLWTTTLISILSVGGAILSLGQWRGLHHKHWIWYMDPDTAQLYRRSGGQWLAYGQRQGLATRADLQTALPHSSTPVPGILHCTTISRDGQGRVNLEGHQATKALDLPALSLEHCLMHEGLQS